VILWSLFAPLGAVAFDRRTRAWPWFAAFVATIGLTLPRAGAWEGTAAFDPRPRPLASVAPATSQTPGGP
jgi:hypothetical protein